MNALNLPVKFPTEALPRWANRWAFDYTSNTILPVKYVNGLVWITSPNDAGALPQVPTGIVILDDPYTPIERFLWLLSAACLLIALIANVSGCSTPPSSGYTASDIQHRCIHGEIWAVNEHGRVNLGGECNDQND